MPTKTPTAAEIQKRLNDRTASLNSHFAAIRQEFAPLAQIADGTATTEPKEPLGTIQKVGIAVGATFVLGILLGLKSRRKKLSRAENAGATVRMYVDHLLDEAAQLAAKGKDPDDALRRVLQRKPAIVQVETLDLPEEKSAIIGALSSIAGAALSFGLKTAIDLVATQVKRKDA